MAAWWIFWSLSLRLSCGEMVKRWEEVGFTGSLISGPGVPDSLSLNGKDSGCKLNSVGMSLTCQDLSEMESPNPVPSNAFRLRVDCSSMDASKFDLLTVQAASGCSKLTFTQQLQVEESVSKSMLQMKPGQIANLTCVLFPLAGQKNIVESSDWKTAATPTLDFTAKNSKSGETGTLKALQLTPLKYIEIQNLDPKVEDQVDSKACSRAVQNLFEWKLSLQQSKQNVHQLKWTSHPQKTTLEPVPTPDLTAPFHVTGCLKDVSFMDLQPSIMTATAQKEAQGDFKDRLRFTVLEDPLAREDPGWTTGHEELIQVTVDATQLPKGTKKLHVIWSYTIPNQFERYVTMDLPVDDPVVPDTPTTQPDAPTDAPTDAPATTQPDGPAEEPEPPKAKGKKKGPGAWPWLLALALLFAAGCGAFLYRRQHLVRGERAQRAAVMLYWLRN